MVYGQVYWQCMASLRLRRGSKKWYACITLPGSKQIQFSTGLTDEAEAMAVAVAAERAARKFSTEPHQLRISLERLADEFVPKGEDDPAEWLEHWATSRTHEVKASTLATYRNTANEAARWLRDAKVTSFSALTPALLTRLRDHWASTSQAITANTKIKHLRIALNTAVIEKRLPDNPAKQVGALKNARTQRREFRPAEIQLLMPTLKGEWRAVFFLGLYTGQRLNDLCELKWCQLDLSGRTITFEAAKTGALVALPLHDSALDALVALPSSDRGDDPVFPRLAGLAKSSRSNEFRSLLAEVGLATKPNPNHKVTSEHGRRGRRTTSALSFHSLRHTATSMLKAAGVSDAIARAIIGHESAAVSRAYTHLDLDTMRQALDKMPKI